MSEEANNEPKIEVSKSEHEGLKTKVETLEVENKRLLDELTKLQQVRGKCNRAKAKRIARREGRVLEA